MPTPLCPRLAPPWVPAPPPECEHPLESPQWRKGPPQYPILCNACGTRWLRNGTLKPLVPRRGLRYKNKPKPLKGKAAAAAEAEAAAAQAAAAAAAAMLAAQPPAVVLPPPCPSPLQHKQLAAVVQPAHSSEASQGGPAADGDEAAALLRQAAAAAQLPLPPPLQVRARLLACVCVVWRERSSGAAGAAKPGPRVEGRSQPLTLICTCPSRCLLYALQAAMPFMPALAFNPAAVFGMDPAAAAAAAAEALKNAPQMFAGGQPAAAAAPLLMPWGFFPPPQPAAALFQPLADAATGQPGVKAEAAAAADEQQQSQADTTMVDASPLPAAAAVNAA